MTTTIDEKNLVRIDRMKKMLVASSVALVGIGLPAMMTPSALAYEGTMNSLTTMDMAYSTTATGYSVNINAKDLATIKSSGITLEAYINEELYLMLDEVIVDMDALYTQHGVSDFNINIDKTDGGFNYYLTANANGQQVNIDQLSGTSFVGQVSRGYLNTNQDSKLYLGTTEVQQMNYDGDMFVVFEAQGEYNTTATKTAESTSETQDEDIIVIETTQEETGGTSTMENTVVTDSSDDIIEVTPKTETITLFDSGTSKYEDNTKVASQGRDDDIIEVDSTELVNKLDEGKTNTNINVEEYARKEKQNNLSKATDKEETPVQPKNLAKEKVQNTEVVKVASVNNIMSGTKAIEFEDISGVYSEEAIKSLASQGVIETQSTLFKPHQAISREQFAVIVANALGVESTNEVAFTDVKDSPSSYKIQALYEAGIFLGDNGEFKPNDTLSRQQASAVLVRTLHHKGYDTSTLASTPKFEDKDTIALYAKESVAILQQLGVVDGTKEGKFEPYGQLTNAQIAKMVYNVMGIIG